MPWFYPYQNDKTRQAQLGGVAMWVALYMVGPESGYVLAPERRSFVDGWLQPLPQPGADWTEFADAFGWQPGTIEDRKLALIQIYWRLCAYLVTQCNASPDFDTEYGNICDLRQQAVDAIDAINADEASAQLGAAANSADAIAIGNMRRVELIAGAPRQNYFLGADVQVHFGWKQVITVIAALVGSLVGTPAVGAAIGATLAVVLSVGASVVSVATGIVDAVLHGGSVAAAMQQGLGQGVTQWLQSEAKLLVPQDVQNAAGVVAQASKGVKFPW
jgi:hypothetical protein